MHSIPLDTTELYFTPSSTLKDVYDWIIAHQPEPWIPVKESTFQVCWWHRISRQFFNDGKTGYYVLTFCKDYPLYKIAFD